MRIAGVRPDPPDTRHAGMLRPPELHRESTQRRRARESSPRGWPFPAPRRGDFLAADEAGVMTEMRTESGSHYGALLALPAASTPAPAPRAS
jgi:hypothetical protein